MKSLSFISLAAVAFVAIGCERHETPVPNGTDQRVEIPADIANVLPTDVFPSAKRTARACQNGDVTSCNQLAGWVAYGKEVPKYEQARDNDAHIDVSGENDGAHGDDGHAPAAEAHGDAEHGDDGHGNAEHDTHADSEHEVAHDEVHGHSYVGFEPNPSAAAPLFSVACDGGVEDACIELVSLSANGHFEMTNERRTQLLQTACRERAYKGCVLAAELASDGKVDISPADAAASVESACQAFYEPACAFLRGTDDRTAPLPGAEFNFLFETVKNDSGITIRAILPSQGVASQVRTSANDVFREGAQVQTDFHIDTAMIDTSWVQTIPSLLVIQRELTDVSSTVRLDTNKLSISGGSPTNPTFLTTLIEQVTPQLHGRQVDVQLGADDSAADTSAEQAVQ